VVSIAEAFVDLKFTEHLAAQLQSVVRAIGDLSVKVDGDTTKIRNAIRKVAGDLGDMTIRVDGDATGLRTAIRSVVGTTGKIKIKVELDQSAVNGVRAKAQILRRYLLALFNRIPVRLELTGVAGLLAQLALIQAALGALGGAGGGGGGGGPGLPDLGSLIGGVQAQAAQLAAKLALGVGAFAAITVAASLLVSILVALLGALLALVPVLLTVFPAALGLVGVFGAIAIATDGMGAALSAASSGNVKAFDKAMKQLTPSAQSFVRTLLTFSPALKDIQKSTQQALFNGLGKWLKDAATNLLPTVKAGLYEMAGVASLAGRTVLHALSFPSSAAQLKQIIYDVDQGFSAMAGQAGNATLALLDVSQAAGGPLNRLLTDLSADLGDFFQSIDKASSSGKLTSLINNAVTRFQELWDILKSILSIFGSFILGADAAGSSFKPLLDLLKQWAAYFASPEGQAQLKEMFAKAQETFQKIMPVIGSLVAIGAEVINWLILMGPTFADAAVQAKPFLDAMLAMMVSMEPMAPFIAGVLIVVLGVFVVVLGLLAIALFVGIAAIVIFVAAVAGPIVAAIVGIVALVQNWGTVMNWLGGVFGAIGAWIASVAVAVAGWVAGAWNNVVAWTVAAWNNVINFIKGVVTNVANTIGTWQTTIRTKVKAAWDAAYNAVTSTVGNIVNFVKSIPGKLLAALGNLGNLLVGAGKAVIDGLYRGIQAAIGSVKSLLSSVTNLIPSWKGPMDVDLRLLTPSGQALITGLMKGIDQQTPALRNQLNNLTGMIPTGVEGMGLPSVVGGSLNVRASDAANHRIEDLLKKLVAVTQQVGGDVGNTINGQGRKLTQSSRGVV
jgi:hypothetical protein